MKEKNFEDLITTLYGDLSKEIVCHLRSNFILVNYLICIMSSVVLPCKF